MTLIKMTIAVIHSSIIWPVWLNGWVFVYELSGCGFESSWSHLILVVIIVKAIRAYDKILGQIELC